MEKKLDWIFSQFREHLKGNKFNYNNLTPIFPEEAEASLKGIYLELPEDKTLGIYPETEKEKRQYESWLSSDIPFPNERTKIHSFFNRKIDNPKLTETLKSADFYMLVQFLTWFDDVNDFKRFVSKDSRFQFYLSKYELLKESLELFDEYPNKKNLMEAYEAGKALHDLTMRFMLARDKLDLIKDICKIDKQKAIDYCKKIKLERTLVIDDLVKLMKHLIIDTFLAGRNYERFFAMKHDNAAKESHSIRPQKRKPRKYKDDLRQNMYDFYKGILAELGKKSQAIRKTVKKIPSRGRVRVGYKT